MEKRLFDEIILKHYQEAYRLAYSVLHHQANSQDILHTAIEKAYKKKNQLKELDKSKSWFMTIVYNEARQWIRREKRSIAVEDLSYLEGADDMHQSHQVMMVEGYLSLIKEQDRSLITMKYLLDYTFEEISQITHLPISTVKSKIYRSLKIMNQKKEREVLVDEC